MKLSMSSGLLVLTAALCTVPATAHVGRGILPVYKIGPGFIDVNDGSLLDWEEIAPEATAVMEDFLPLAGRELDPGDLAFRAFVGWSEEEQRIYVGVERVDDLYVNEYDGSGVSDIYKHDGVTFYIDADHSGGQYDRYSSDSFSQDEIDLLRNSQAQAYSAVAVSPNGRTIAGFNKGTWVTEAPWAEAGGGSIGQEPNVSVIEFAITPWDLLDWRGQDNSRRTVLREGAIIGFGFDISDFDLGPLQFDGGWSTSDAPSFFDAGQFVDGILLCGEADCVGTITSAVAGDSWGRIKASWSR